jgi:hypothetical protein
MAKNRNWSVSKVRKISFRSDKTKGPKQDTQNRLRSPITEAGEPKGLNRYSQNRLRSTITEAGEPKGLNRIIKPD